jgi:hypothetical protein
MVGAIRVLIRHPDGATLFDSVYPNGVVRNHHAAGCC